MKNLNIKSTTFNRAISGGVRGAFSIFPLSGELWRTFRASSFSLLRGLKGAYWAFVLLILLAACTTRPKSPEKKTFPFVNVPAIYATEQAQAEYLVLHFWDNFDFADTTWIGSAEVITEQALIQYISIFPYTSYDVICRGMKRLLDQADGNQAMYAFFYSKMEYFFANPNSQLRNDEYYIPLLEHIIASNSLDAPRKVRPAAILPFLNKNRPGTPATNIHFTRPSGAKDELANVKSDYILVVFYDFDCEDCNVLKKMIEESAIIKERQKQRKLAIVAIYPGANMEGWKKSSPQIPASWINGYDHNEEIVNQGTYILRNIPTLYLLDKEYMVIMKEPPFEYVEYYLNSIET